MRSKINKKGFFICLLILLLSTSLHSQTKNGYYTLAGLSALGSIGCLVIFIAIPDVDAPEPYEDYSEQAQLLQDQELVKWGSLGVCIGLAWGFLFFMDKAENAIAYKDDGIITASFGKEARMYIPRNFLLLGNKEIRINILTVHY
jgi:hypothetical protein